MTAKRILLAPMVGGLRWMTRLMPPVARAMVKWVAEREVIACGLRAADGSVRIIFSLQSGHSGHRVLRKEAGEWVPADSSATDDFASGLVHQVVVSNAQIGDVYRVVANHPNRRALSSPAIHVKPETRCLSSLNVEFDQAGGALISWPKERRTGAMLYFFTIQKQGGPATVGAYTRDRFLNFPDLLTASLTIGISDPPPLALGTEYKVQVVVVDYEGWVGTAFTWSGARLR